MGPWDPAPPAPETSGPETPGPEPKRRGSRVWIRVLVIAALIVLVAFLVGYLANARFSIREISTSDDYVDLELIEPIPPPAVPPAPPPAPRTTRGPDGEVLRPQVWVKQPAPDFPQLALRRGVEQGVVVLRCETLVTGEFGACEVLSETPPGVGFGEAALAATRDARVTPYSIDGFETDGSIQFTVRFQPPAER